MNDSDDPDSILSAREENAKKAGGEARIARQREKGKLTARDRINLLLDAGTFQENDMFIAHRCTDFGLDADRPSGDGVVAGYGDIDGRSLFVFAQDFTVSGGSLGEMHAKKIVKAMDMALDHGRPIVGLNDSAGARIQEGVASLAGYGDIFYRNVKASGVVPQLSVIMGPCAGGAVYSPALTDFVIMVDKTAYMFITGPQVVKAVTFEDVTKEHLGGAKVHNEISGVAHFVTKTESQALELVQRLLSYLPSNNSERPPRVKNDDPPDRPADKLRGILPDSPRIPYDAKEIIKDVTDSGSFLEVHMHFAKNVVIGFARLDGHSVGIVANQPLHLAGTLDIDASDKASRFIRFCDAFNIPLITFMDVPGFLPGVQQEHRGIIRHGAKLLFAYSEATVPKLAVIVRKAYGGAYIVMSSRHLGADQVFAWPNAEIAVMGSEGAANIIFRKEIAASDNPEETRADLIKMYRSKLANPYVAAELGYIDAVIRPEETREKLCRALAAMSTKRQWTPPKKHGNMPM